MSRPLRIEYPGAWYHVMNRGRRREDIFLSDSDRNSFLQLLKETDEMWNFEVAAFCLMSNHYHLLVHTPDGNLSRCMRHVNGVYTQRFNRQHNKDGQLFRGRYKAVLVDEDSHLLEVLRYIHRNPLRAGIATNLEEYVWSSHRGYLSKYPQWEWLHTDFLLGILSTNKRSRHAAYLDFVSLGDSPEIERFYSLKNLPSILGSDSFKEMIKEKFSHLLFHKEIPESRTLATDAETILDSVCRHFVVSRKDLMVSRRGVENLPRDMAIYLVRQHTGETLSGVGGYFGIENYSTVSSAVERIKAQKTKNRQLKKIIEKLVNGLAVSQKQI